MRLAAILLIAALQTNAGARPTIVAKPSSSPQRNFIILFYDDAFLFAARNYGRANDVGGNTEPGLFVHSKEKSAWMEITAISTAGGRFGRSSSDDPEARKKLNLASVYWDYTAYAQRPYIEQPMRTPGSVVFPEHIDYDAGAARYRLRYFSSWEIPSAETVLFISRADLVTAFAARK